MISKALFSSASTEWETPQDLFDKLNEEFHFTLDVCATAENAKCKKFYTKEQNGLVQSWRGNVCWMNPPYGRGVINAWVKKAFSEWIYYDLNHTPIVGLLPARTDTQWFHTYIYNMTNIKIRFVSGRLKFGGSKNSAPFPSMIVVWR